MDMETPFLLFGGLETYRLGRLGVSLIESFAICKLGAATESSRVEHPGEVCTTTPREAVQRLEDALYNVAPYRQEACTAHLCSGEVRTALLPCNLISTCYNFLQNAKFLFTMAKVSAILYKCAEGGLGGQVHIVRYAPVAQLDSACDSDSQGRWFESSRAYQKPA